MGLRVVEHFDYDYKGNNEIYTKECTAAWKQARTEIRKIIKKQGECILVHHAGMYEPWYKKPYDFEVEYVELHLNGEKQRGGALVITKKENPERNSQIYKSLLAVLEKDWIFSTHEWFERAAVLDHSVVGNNNKHTTMKDGTLWISEFWATDCYRAVNLLLRRGLVCRIGEGQYGSHVVRG